MLLGVNGLKEFKKIKNKVYKTTVVVRHGMHLSPAIGKQYLNLFKIFTHKSNCHLAFLLNKKKSMRYPVW